MRKLNIAVLMGGVSSEHKISLISGQNVFESLDRKKYRVKSIVIGKKGDWLVSGRKKTIDKALKGIDVVFNALHGEYGEDGRIQGLLECFGVKYTGSGVLASALGIDKIKSRELFRFHGLFVPEYVVIEKKSDYSNIDFKKLGEKLVVKPASLGSSVGISIIPARPAGGDGRKNLNNAIDKAFEKCDKVIVEEYVSGREMTCGVIDNPAPIRRGGWYGASFKGQKYFALPVTEIIPPPGRFFDYQVKYDGSTQEITPAKIDKELAIKIQEIAKKAHQILDCRGYSRTDMIVRGNKVYILEVNTLPGLTKESLIPKAARAIGIEFFELLDIIINNA